MQDGAERGGTGQMPDEPGFKVVDHAHVLDYTVHLFALVNVEAANGVLVRFPVVDHTVCRPTFGAVHVSLKGEIALLVSVVRRGHQFKGPHAEKTVRGQGSRFGRSGSPYR